MLFLRDLLVLGFFLTLAWFTRRDLGVFRDHWQDLYVRLGHWIPVASRCLYIDLN